MADDTTVAVLGTGIMGAAMARNLLSASMKVRAWNRSREKAEPLEGDGAEVADNPDDDFPTSFSARLARKDAGLVLAAAEAHDLRTQIAESVAARFDEAIEAGHGEEDMAAVYSAAWPDRS